MAATDPDDIERQLRVALLKGDLEPYLTVDDVKRYGEDAQLVEMLSNEEMTDVVGPTHFGE